MKIGIMGGTFDPIHNGHLMLGEYAYRQFKLDKIWYMPNGCPPHKNNAKIGSEALTRAEMVRLAISKKEYFCLQDYEIVKDTTSYSYATLEYFKETYPNDSFYFIIGADSLFNIEKWKCPDRLLKTCIILAAYRDGKNKKEMEEKNIVEVMEETVEEVVLKIEGLTKEYKMYERKKDRLLETIFPFYNKHISFKALNNLNLQIKKGEILGILGENGAGKSTLLKIITGVVFPTSGTIEKKGQICSLLELGTAFNSELTGEENIYQHGEIFGLTKKEIEDKKAEIIEFADIGEHLYQPVKTYSSGMFARLAFACAINVNPDILIVDEVLSVGDMSFQIKCFKKFEEFKKQGKTILFVSHSVSDIIRNCNRTIIISKGTKIFDGDVKTGVDLYKKMIVGAEKDSTDIKKQREKNSKIIDTQEEWKKHFTGHEKDLLTYGNKKAEIIDYGVFDLDGNIQTVINNNDKFLIKMKVKFNTDIEEPIFALAIKDIKGLELAGANTRVNKTKTGTYKKGDIAIIEFEQQIPLAPDKYTLSFGCTKFNAKGKLEVFDRKYDAIFIEILGYRESLGLLDLKAQIDLNVKRSE